MFDYNLIMDEIAPKFGDSLKPLICLVVPRIHENALLITVSDRHSDRYLSTVVKFDRFANSAYREKLTADICSAFNLGDNYVLGSA